VLNGDPLYDETKTLERKRFLYADIVTKRW
jgi:hypothetical protein